MSKQFEATPEFEEGFALGATHADCPGLDAAKVRLVKALVAFDKELREHAKTCNKTPQA